jgi:hypothetical protein
VPLERHDTSGRVGEVVPKRTGGGTRTAHQNRAADTGGSDTLSKCRGRRREDHCGDRNSP